MMTESIPGGFGNSSKLLPVKAMSTLRRPMGNGADSADPSLWVERYT